MIWQAYAPFLTWVVGVLTGATGAHLLTLRRARLSRRPRPPLPAIGQRWLLRGVGAVRVFGLDIEEPGSFIKNVRYEFESIENGERVLNRTVARTQHFLQQATLIEEGENALH